MRVHPVRISFYLLSVAVGSTAGHVCGVESDRQTSHYSPYPVAVNVRQGISWPEGQALPIFATPAETLDTIDVQALSRDERILFSALQGHVNKQQPRIYLVDSRTDEGRDTWADTATMALGPRNFYDKDTRYDVVAKYAKEVSGLVLYDPQRSPHYRNLAGTLAGIRNALPATPEIQRRLRERGIDLDVVADLTGLELSSPLEIYRHLYEHYWPECEKRLIVSAKPHDRGGDHHHTRDVAAACGAAVVWLDCRNPDEREIMRRFLGDMRAGNAVVLGWYTSERSGIATASEFGIGTIPADHYISASVYAGTDHRILIPPVPKKPRLENKVYIALFISDGDNIQYAQRAMRRVWDRSSGSRGQVPMNWTIAPGLVDIGPGILNYYYTTATPNDCFVAGPSGMGYALPCNTLEERGAPLGCHPVDPDRMNGYARLTETYLQRAGLRVLTIWDNANPMQRASYERHCRNLYGATVHNFRDVPSVEAGVENERIRFDKLVIPYADSYDRLHRSLMREIRRWDGGSPLFRSYQVSIWSEMKPGRIAELVLQISSRFPGKVQFVRADHYFNLYNEAHGLPFNLAMSPQASATASSSIESVAAVCDGTSATAWSSSDDDAPWLSFDLGEDCKIMRYVIRHAGDGGLSREYNTRDYTVQVSSDGTMWQTVDVYRKNTENVTDVNLEPVHGRFVKIVIEDPGKDSVARIADVEIFAVTER